MILSGIPCTRPLCIGYGAGYSILACHEQLMLMSGSLPVPVLNPLWIHIFLQFLLYGNIGKTSITPSRLSPHLHMDSTARLSCSFIITSKTKCLTLLILQRSEILSLNDLIPGITQNCQCLLVILSFCQYVVCFKG